MRMKNVFGDWNQGALRPKAGPSLVINEENLRSFQVQIPTGIVEPSHSYAPMTAPEPVPKPFGSPRE